jgi:DeoR/GlpR family transcriptional regulator of sugar metabolism
LVTSRQRIILGILEVNELATVEQLSSQLSVSEATVRRDLLALESERLINRTWGGATPVASVAFEPFVNERSKQNQAEKAAIAQAAVEMVEEGEVIALDVGTTCMELAKLLLRFQRITVFTNSLLTAQILGASNLTVHLIGGRLRPGEYSMVGAVARETILRFHYDKFFMGASGFDLKNGPTDFNLDDVEVKQCFLKQAKQRITLVDNTKFAKTSLASICAISELTDVITDSLISSTHAQALEQQGVKVTIGQQK